MKNLFSMNNEVTILTGKYKGKKGHTVCYTKPHQLSSEKRLQVKVQTGSGWKTLLINENNLTLF